MSGERTEISGRGHSGFRPTGRGRGGKANAANAASSAGGQGDAVRLQTTHFLALPLINHPSLMAQINAFQRGLFSDVDGLDQNIAQSTSRKGSRLTTVKSSLVGGLDSSILIDPRRLHMTLGVMALEEDDGLVEMPTKRPETSDPQNASSKSMTTNLQPPASTVSSIQASPTSPPASQPVSSHRPFTQSQHSLAPATPPTTPLSTSTKKTVSTALYLLNSLKPRISEILDCDRGVKLPLQVMHVLKTEKMWINSKKRTIRAADKKEGAGGGERNEVDEHGGRDDPRLPHNDDMPEKEAIGAGVLYVAPDIRNEGVNKDLRKLIQVSNLVHQAFKDAGYLTDTRPLKAWLSLCVLKRYVSYS